MVPGTFDNKLANAVRRKPILYNNRLKDFRNNTKKENACVEVAAAVGGTGKYICVWLYSGCIQCPRLPYQ